MSKRVILACMCFVMCAATVTAQETKYSVDKVVAVVGNSAILYSDVQEAVVSIIKRNKEEQYTSDRDPVNEALEGLLLQKLLYNQAQIDSVLISTDAVTQEVEKNIAEMTADAGSVQALEEKNGRPYFEIKQNMRDKMEEMFYAQSMHSDITSKVTITPGEVERYYKNMAKDSLPMMPEQYVYAQITKYPKSSKEAKQKVKESLLELRERIIAGTRFEVLAMMYSVDSGTAQNGGDLGFMNLKELVQPFAQALEKLQPGQISEVVETEFGFHILQLVEKKGDLYRSRHILLKPVYTPEELAEGGRLLDSLANQIKSGAITFEAAALKYSDDKYSKNNGGVVTNHEMLESYNNSSLVNYSTTKFMREDLRADYPVLHALAQNEISQSFQAYDMRGNSMNKIVKIIKIIPAHTPNMNEDYSQIEQYALQEKQNDEFEKWLNTKIDGMYIRIAPEFRDLDFNNKNWVK